MREASGWGKLLCFLDRGWLPCRLSPLRMMHNEGTVSRESEVQYACRFEHDVPNLSSVVALEDGKLRADDSITTDHERWTGRIGTDERGNR